MGIPISNFYSYPLDFLRTRKKINFNETIWYIFLHCVLTSWTSGLIAAILVVWQSWTRRSYEVKS